MPALLGAFWGAPLVAGELESGTYRLAWTQSITRTRWLAVKVGVIGLTSVAVTGLLSLMLGAWSNAATNQDRFGTAMFGERGIAPIGYAAFGFALGVTAGLLIRRTVPAMAATLVAFMAVRIVIQTLGPTPLRDRAHSIAATLRRERVAPPRQPRRVGALGALRRSDRPRHQQHPRQVRCGPDPNTCIAKYHQVLSYQPASRYWAFQSYETAIFACLAIILIGLCFRWIRTRIS